MEVAKLSSDVREEGNARLLEENQNLRQMVEERDAELAIIQSVQEGLASRLDVQSIYDLVGDKIREIFHAQGTAVYIFNHETEILETPYCYLKKRFEIESRPFSDHPIASLMINTLQPLTYRNVEEYRALGGAVLENSDEYKSGMYVPLMVGKELKGMVGIANLDKENAYNDSDLRLLQTLANSLSVALENARLFDETEQRAAELAIINTVQEGLASKLDIQAIYDLVGDKIRGIFQNSDVEIRIYDPKTNLIHFPYFTDNKKRVAVDPILLTDLGMSSYVLRTGNTVVISEDLLQEIEKYGSKMLPGGHPAKSAVFVPLVVSNQARGLIALGNVEREHAFSESDVRLLQTLANSMSTALENARLFDEAQNLLKETEQRAAELQIINSVQEGLASKLDMQAIYDLVGDKIRDLFNAQSVWIQIYDQATRTRHFRYGFYRQPIYISEALPYNKLTEHLIATKKPLVINQDADARKAEFEMVIVAGSEMFKSALFVPLIAGGDVKGTITLQNMEQENVFSESDISLLSTLASSMSVALENARLFDETQRLLNETEQRNAELAIINSVQAGLAEGLASKRDMQDIYDLVGDKIRELFPNTDTEIRIYDPKTNLFQVPYYIENGQRVAIDPISPSDATISAHVLSTGQTVVINENIFQEMEKYGAKMMRGRRIPAKSVIFVPLMVGNQARGLIVLNNVEREHAFSQSDVRLFETLASSMSTALENARLFDEVQKKNAESTESLERETASNDILRIIAESPTDIQPVLDVIARNAAQLSGSDDVIITLRDGDILHVDAHYGDIPTFSAREGMRFNRDSVAGRAILEDRPLQAIHNEPGVQSEYPEGDKVAKKYGYRMTCAVPLMREGKAIGAISIRRIKPELLIEKQIALIESFANQAAIAVENVRLFNETTRLLKETEQRAAELQIINSVQEGLASKLDMQAIYDLVGDKIRDLFSAQSVWILTFDRIAKTRRVEYSFENGQRYYTSDLLPFNKLTEYLIATKKTLVFNDDADTRIAEFEMASVAGTERFKSAIFVPLIAEGDVKGFISLQNIERENAFSESDISLLSTLASSMSVALENARLFDETQRLLKETEQRNAELAIINSVQEGLASKLDIQSIYEMVGEQLHQVFPQFDISVASYDPENDLITTGYMIEHGKRIDLAPFQVGSQGFISKMIRTREMVLVNENMEEESTKVGSRTLNGTDTPKSHVLVPLIIHDVVRGLVVMQDMQREQAFLDSDIRLLETIANSMSIALENARLFDETQRLLDETEQRNAELAIINSVQEGLSSKLDMQAIYELVGDKMQEIFDAQSLLIVNFDHVNELAQMTYNREKGVRYYSEPYPLTGLHRYLIQSRNTVVINENSLEWQKKFGMILVPGTESPKSMIFVPLTAGYRVSGFISLQNLEREHAFSDTDVRLLETLASSMSVALENASLFDETQRLFLEAKEARTAAEQADQAKSAFLSSMSHELRTPLNAIINFVEMVARGMIGPVNREQVDLLDQALHSSKHLLNLINDVLDISKIQAGQLTLFIEDQVSVQVEVETTLSIVGGLIQEKGLRLIRDIDPHLPMVSCDRRRLRQVLLNLVSNAIKFTHEGTVTVSVKNQGQEVLFAVIDTGPGIPLDKQDFIFEPFLQAENGERQMQGTGLGLPISRSLVRAHGGELWVDSQSGEGSAFFFTLPVERRNAP